MLLRRFYRLMSIIQKLPSDIVNRIAAGEVIERPASVIKELVENSIDAGATEILIDLEDGGCKRLTGGDNGCGMDPSDLQMAFERPSTRKLDTDGFREGMCGVGTRGFRGAARPARYRPDLLCRNGPARARYL